jgi:restriction system protein
MAAKISRERVGQMLQITLAELKSMGGEARLKDLLGRVEPKLNLNTYEKETYEKSGYVRWQSVIHFYSIDCIKAGFLQKSGGHWIITPQGIEALQMSPADFIRTAQQKYRDWKSSKPASPIEIIEQEETEKVVRQTAYEQAIEQAQSEIEDFIHKMGWYDFQKLVAELLTAMGYHVAHIAPPGPDGGVDIIAYKDPLGTTVPRIKVQVKHRSEKVKVQEVRELHGLLRDEDIGIFVSSGGFTKDAIEEARKMSKHIDTMDLSRLIGFWQQYYETLRESGKALLPLTRLYFLAPVEEN